VKRVEFGTFQVCRSDLEIHLRKDASIGFRADFSDENAVDDGGDRAPRLTLMLSSRGEVEVGHVAQKAINELQGMMDKWPRGKGETRPLSVWDNVSPGFVPASSRTRSLALDAPCISGNESNTSQDFTQVKPNLPAAPSIEHED